jgi:hypothetical protein
MDGSALHNAAYEVRNVAQLAFRNANDSPLIEGPVISLAPRHAKVRREGYRR